MLPEVLGDGLQPAAEALLLPPNSRVAAVRLAAGQRRWPLLPPLMAIVVTLIIIILGLHPHLTAVPAVDGGLDAMPLRRPPQRLRPRPPVGGGGVRVGRAEEELPGGAVPAGVCHEAVRLGVEAGEDAVPVGVGVGGVDGRHLLCEDASLRQARKALEGGPVAGDVVVPEAVHEDDQQLVVGLALHVVVVVVVIVFWFSGVGIGAWWWRMETELALAVQL